MAAALRGAFASHRAASASGAAGRAACDVSSGLITSAPSALWPNSSSTVVHHFDLENNVVVAQIRADAGVQVTSRQRLFSLNGYITSTNYTFYDVSADDQRFVLIRPAGAGLGGTGRLVLIENWFEELKARLN